MQGLLRRGSRKPSVANSEVGILVRGRQPGSRGADGEVGGVQGFHELDEVLGVRVSDSMSRLRPDS